MKKIIGFFKIDKASRGLVYLGVSLVFAILFLAFYFFHALEENQIQSNNFTMSKQIELAGKETEKSFNAMFDDMLFLINNLESWTYERTGNEQLAFERRVKRIFNNHRDLLDTLIVRFPNHLVSFHFDSKNSFIQQFRDPDKKATVTSNAFLLKNSPKSLSVKVFVNLERFAENQLSNYYLGATASKFIIIDNEMYDLVDDSYFFGYQLDDSSQQFVQENLQNGLKGMVEGMMIQSDIVDLPVWIYFYPVRLYPLEKEVSMVFIQSFEGNPSRAYTAYIYIIIALLSLIVIVFFILYQFNYAISSSNKSLAKSAKEIEELFKRQTLLLQESNGFIYFQNEKNEMISVGEEVKNVLGYEKEDFLKNFQSFIAPESLEPLRVASAKSIEKKQEIFKSDFFLFKKNGQKIRVKVFEKLLFDQQGTYQGTVGIFTDIDEQYNVDQERIRSEESLRSVLESLPDLIFIYDNEGNFLDYYVQDETLLLYPPLASIGKNVREVLPEKFGSKVYEMIKNAKESKQIQRIDMELQVPVGTRIFETRIFKLDETRVISIARDVTSQKVWERGLKEAVEAAEQANKAKSEFLANMSHEIRTPMNALLGIVSLIETTHLNAQQVEYIQLLRSSGKNLSGIINDILDYSKIESGAMSLKPIVFHFKKEMEQSFQLFEGLLKEKKINFSFQYQGDIPDLVEVDREKLVQVISNILSNSIKFTQSGGYVHVNLSCEPIIDDTIMLLFEVKDSGIGIPKNKISELTEPFFQLDGSNTREYQGTGLGLAISKKILELMGGELLIESEEGLGSVFSFSVFAKSISEKAIPEQQIVTDGIEKRELNPSFGKKYPLSILIAEDNNTNIVFMQMLMDQLGYEVDFVVNGLEAVAAVQRKYYDMVFMDIQMPKLNGLEATKEILKLDLINTPQIWGLSANAFNEDREKAIQLGMTGYLSKPIDIEIIAQTLYRIFISVQKK
ncbi:PAS domain-containing hybrid sensor histidine kinase/response regulator [Mongoliitalea daihaiensis]|uniref:PAS domain-containing hybrid sensor histidine kinase/response regulator n=1 Tax=Mongoliitalea daihaiensis TaxID=2782006 RepID=UPI001F36A326|nr:PAS domain-containing hybrid sensor histidine kinase/response regulator [Mongoliitalea daihaiensis]UJP63727.1 response regulator [Mongoliitalea daihaiensis]